MLRFADAVGAAGFAVSLSALLGGCAATRQVSEVKPVGGFLPQPGALKPGESGQAALFYLNPDARWGSYGKMLLEPVTVWTAGDSRPSGLGIGIGRPALDQRLGQSDPQQRARAPGQ